MAPLSVREAVAKFLEAQAEEQGKEPAPEKFYPLPNRRSIRAFRFGGVREPGTGVQVKRSRIQRGISRPGQRGVVLTHGMVGAASKYGA